jgi:hypothetical protein
MKTGTRLAALALLATLGSATQASAASVTISPLAGTPTALPGTQISFLGPSAKALGSVSVVGSVSGRHSGRLRSYSSATGSSFLPSKPFIPGERVSVRATWAISKQSRRMLSDSFTIAQPSESSESELADTPGTATYVQSFQSQPALHPPTVTIDHAAGAGVAPGYVFAAPFLGPGQHGPMIFDNAGDVVWFHPLQGNEAAADFQTQNFHGKNMLTWWQGHTLALGYGLGEDVIVNANYKTVAVVKAGNGLQADDHEFAVTPEGSAYLTAYSPVHASLAATGSPASGDGTASGDGALDGVVQRIDVHTGLVMWEWHSLAGAAFAEPHAQPPADLALTAAPRAQSLSGGGSMTGGGDSPGFAELDAHGASIFAGALPAGERSYGVYREPWAGQPSEPPAISARTSGASAAVYASWNGATTVTAWQLLTGSSASHMTAVSTTPKTGFETTIPAPAAAYVQVRALSASGAALATSKAVRPASG